MEAGSRKRCSNLLALSLVGLLVLLVWIHGEIVTVNLVESTKIYLNNDEIPRDHARERQKHNFAYTTAAARVGGTTVYDVMNATNESSALTDFTSGTLSSTGTQLDKMKTANATIVVFLSGELGNHLSIIAKALSVKLVAQQQFNITAKLVFRHQLHSKWTHARDDLQNCFPKLREYDFSAANTDVFGDVAKEQAGLLAQGGWDPERLKVDSDQDSKITIGTSLAYWKSILESPSLQVSTFEIETVTIPFLSVAAWCPLDMLDHYLDEIRDFFKFDKSSCCRLKPAADESVFHLRNFLVEMPQKGKKKGFEELSPNKTANELFGHLNRNDKIAITTRFGGDDVAPYVAALEERGLQVRVIHNQTGTQDFCFIMSAKKELVGTRVSTFVNWAAFLGQSKQANLYRVKSPDTTANIFPLFNWTHCSLKDRVHSDIYTSEEQDALKTNEHGWMENNTSRLL